VNRRLRQRLRRARADLSAQGQAVLKSCLGLTAHEQIALVVVLGIILLGITTRFAVRVLGVEF
jgi:hypothetical protein